MTEKTKEKPRHLGRGLQSLIGPITALRTSPNQAPPIPKQASNDLPANDLGRSLQEISVDSISPNPYQVRTVWDQQELADLAESIKANGVIQPIVVRPNGSRYQLIAGERRFRATLLAALTTIPALIRTATDEEMFELALVENIHRSNLNPIERAKAYQNYLNAFSATQAQAAERLGEGRSVVANYLRLLDLPEEVREMLAMGKLSMGHARAILGLPTDELRRKLANRAMAGRLSVREVERLVRKYLTGSEQSRTAAAKPAHILDLESRLTTQLGTRVSIETRKNGQRGKIVIEFYSLDEFDRISESMGVTPIEDV